MNKIINSLVEQRPWIESIDDQRKTNRTIVVRLAKGFAFANDVDCSVKSYKCATAVRDGVKKSDVILKVVALANIKKN
jgi:hypothetical protein